MAARQAGYHEPISISGPRLTWTTTSMTIHEPLWPFRPHFVGERSSRRISKIKLNCLAPNINFFSQKHGFGISGVGFSRQMPLLSTVSRSVPTVRHRGCPIRRFRNDVASIIWANSSTLLAIASAQRWLGKSENPHGKNEKLWIRVPEFMIESSYTTMLGLRFNCDFLPTRQASIANGRLWTRYVSCKA